MSDDRASDVHFALDHSHAADLMINSLERSVRTRLYFTSESHLHTLLNVLRYPGNDAKQIISGDVTNALESVAELSYMTQIVIRLFETEVFGTGPTYRCEISFSPGAVNEPVTDKSATLAPYMTLTKSIPGQDLVRLFSNAKEKLNEQVAAVQEEIAPLSLTIERNNDSPASRHKRFNETVVLSNGKYETSDTWEDDCSPRRTTKKRIVRRASSSGANMFSNKIIKAFSISLSSGALETIGDENSAKLSTSSHM
jgi:hypothetical protein